MIYKIIALIILCSLLYIICKWFSFKNTAEKLRFLSIIQSFIILLELIGLSAFIMFNLLADNILKKTQYLTITSSTNFRDFVLTDPTAGISVLIGSISIIIIYLYFFNVLRKTKYFSEISEVQEKYSAIFWSFPIILFVGGLVVLWIDFAINTTNSKWFDTILFGIGMLNIVITLPIAYYLQNYFFNSNRPDSETLEIGQYDYKFIENFRILKESRIEELRSDCLLIMTFMWAGLVLVINCNVFFFLVTEFGLLIALFWSSQLRLIPNKKTTFELKVIDNFGKNIVIADVFVLSESSKGYFVILDSNNQISRIMRDSIQRFFVQKE